jgi:hypothetical protein
MSMKEATLDFLSQVLQAFGLNMSGKFSLARVGKLVILFFAVPFYTVLLIALVINLQSFEEKLQIFQIIPFYVVITVKIIDIMVKFKKVTKFIGTVKKMTTEYKNKKFVKKSQSQGCVMLILALLFNFLPPILVQIVSLITQKTFMPVWIPKKMIGYEKLVFFSHWFITTFCGFYASSLVLSIDLLMIHLLLTIKGFSEYLLEKSVGFERSADETGDEIRNLTLLKNANNLKW